MARYNAPKVLSGQHMRYLTSLRRCIMGCPPGNKLHSFPKNPTRRAEWFKILGITSKHKNIYLCSAHFPPNYLFGNRINTHVLPKPRETQTTTTKNHASESEEPSNEPQNQIINPEVIEVRDPASGNHIIIGFYYQANDFLLTTYTQTNKLTHQQQVLLLNNKYEGQLKLLERLKRENHRLTKAVRRHQILFSQLRKIKTKNSTIRRNLKILKEKVKKLSKRVRKENSMDSN